jgi:acyl carrier protein
MEREQVLEEVKGIIVDVLEVDGDVLTESTNLVSDLDAESLDLVDLVVAFEEKYKVKILDKDIKNLQTVKDIVDYIMSKNA